MNLQEDFDQFAQVATAVLRSESAPETVLSQRDSLRGALRFASEPLLGLAQYLRDVAPLQAALAGVEERLKVDEPLVLAIQMHALQGASQPLLESVEQLREELETQQTGFPHLDRLLASLNAYLFGYPVASVLSEEARQLETLVQRWRAAAPASPAYAQALFSLQAVGPLLRAALEQRDWRQAVQAYLQLRQAGVQLLGAEQGAAPGRCPVCAQPRPGVICPHCGFALSCHHPQEPEDELPYLRAVVPMNPPMARLFAALEAERQGRPAPQELSAALTAFVADVEKRLGTLGLDNLQADYWQEALTSLQAGIECLQEHLQAPAPERAVEGELAILRAFQALQSGR